MNSIIFSTEMIKVLPIKTMTRRIVNNLLGFGQITEFNRSETSGYDWTFRNSRMLWNDISNDRLLECCPYGQAGDRLWVRESFYRESTFKKFALDYLIDDDSGKSWMISYQADSGKLPLKAIPAIHMPRWASRTIIERTNTRVERLQEITEEDAHAEGVSNTLYGSPDPHDIMEFHKLWDSLNAKPKPIKRKGVIAHYISFPWAGKKELNVYRGKPWYIYPNPLVWVVGFKQTKQGAE